MKTIANSVKTGIFSILTVVKVSYCRVVSARDELFASDLYPEVCKPKDEMNNEIDINSYMLGLRAANLY